MRLVRTSFVLLFQLLLSHTFVVRMKRRTVILWIEPRTAFLFLFRVSRITFLTCSLSEFVCTIVVLSLKRSRLLSVSNVEFISRNCRKSSFLRNNKLLIIWSIIILFLESYKAAEPKLAYIAIKRLNTATCPCPLLVARSIPYVDESSIVPVGPLKEMATDLKVVIGPLPPGIARLFVSNILPAVMPSGQLGRTSGLSFKYRAKPEFVCLLTVQFALANSNGSNWNKTSVIYGQIARAAWPLRAR